ncbi:MAG TPA: NfuA family Fe-S biogenesis protein [Arenimonas sp.]|uniref:NfuA family Fe-S biogenesis protein n=1 Tax=Arenimonas sp. TaxID=1872635 RepID=UPI002D804179|nr:NfuA family Fe-S biogenesis protein [Arenimonas sp.]HEU0153573.1 NfuA family Fe-S biogenesis protein [Arenimonas sp.]
MINITESAQAYFQRLLQSQGGDAIGIRLSAVNPGTPRADARLEFCEHGDLLGDEWAIECAGFTLYVDAPSAPFLDSADIDYSANATGGQLTIKAPRIKGDQPAGDASLVERVQWLIDSEVNPQLASHKGRVALDSIDADGVVYLRFGGGCHGCGMVDVTLKQGIEKSMMAKIPEVTAVRDATDHSTGSAPYIARG